MSWKATAAVKVLTHDASGEILTAREKLLLFVLADYHNDEQRAAWAGLTALAKASLTSRKHVITLLARLAKRGLIAIESRPQKTNLYRLLFARDPKAPTEKERGGSHPSSLGAVEASSPGIVTSRGDHPSQLASSLKPPYSRQNSKDAPRGASQDTKNETVSTVEDERQFTEKFQTLAREKTFPFPKQPRDPVRADLYRGIHWKRIENALVDLQRQSFEDQLREAMHVAAGDLFSNRVGKMMVLQQSGVEGLVREKLARGLATLRGVSDFTRRVHLMRNAIANAVISAAAELLEARRETSTERPP